MSTKEHSQNTLLTQAPAGTTQDTSFEAENAREHFCHRLDFLSPDKAKKAGDTPSAQVANFPISRDNSGSGVAPSENVTKPSPDQNSLVRSNPSVPSKQGRPKKYDHRPHGPTMRTIRKVRERCLNKNNPDYPQYGPAMLCERWQTKGDRFTMYMDLIAEIGPKPTKHHTLDRVDNSRPYAPGNIRWATPTQQNKNKRKSEPMTTTNAELARTWKTLWWEYHGLKATIDPKTHNLINHIAKYIEHQKVSIFWGERERSDPTLVLWFFVFHWVAFIMRVDKEKTSIYEDPLEILEAQDRIRTPSENLKWLYQNVEYMLSIVQGDLPFFADVTANLWAFENWTYAQVMEYVRRELNRWNAHLPAACRITPVHDPGHLVD